MGGRKGKDVRSSVLRETGLGLRCPLVPERRKAGRKR